MTLLLAPTRPSPTPRVNDQSWPPVVECCCAKRELRRTGVHAETCPVVARWALTDTVIERAAARVKGLL